MRTENEHIHYHKKKIKDWDTRREGNTWYSYVHISVPSKACLLAGAQLPTACEDAETEVDTPLLLRALWNICTHSQNIFSFVPSVRHTFINHTLDKPPEPCGGTAHFCRKRLSACSWGDTSMHALFYSTLGFAFFFLFSYFIYSTLKFLKSQWRNMTKKHEKEGNFRNAFYLWEP